MKFKQIVTIGTISLALAACGGSSGSGDDNQGPGLQATNITAAGKITGFGSIYVNGIKFETRGAAYEIDDAAGSGDADLSVGMYVVVKGSVNADGSTGTAESVYYDDEVEGPVSNLASDPADATIKTFTVFHTAVSISSSTTVFESEDGTPFSFDSIMDGDNVEVSGEYIGDILHATYIELQEAGDNEYEVKGTVSGFNGVDMFTLTLGNGATLNVTLDTGAEIPDGGIMDGQYVEVEGTIPDPVNFPDDILATEVEIEDDDYFGDDDDEVEIKGPLTLNDDSSWSINGTTIIFSASTEYDPVELAQAIDDGSAHGLVVEVEGRYMDGALHADEVELEDDELEFVGTVAAVNEVDAKNGTITLAFGGAIGTLDFIVNNETFFKNDSHDVPFDLTTLPLDSVAEVYARRNDAGDIVATMLEIEDDRLEIEMFGTVDAIDEVSITILGITFVIDGRTEIDGPLPVVGGYAELADENADGIAEYIEADD